MIATTARIPPNDRLATVQAELRTSCHKAGHPLADEKHGTDLWIEATALPIGIPLVTHDGIFFDTPGLEAISELAP